MGMKNQIYINLGLMDDTEVNTIQELNAYQKKYFTLNGKTT